MVQWFGFSMFEDIRWGLRPTITSLVDAQKGKWTYKMVLVTVEINRIPLVFMVSLLGSVRIRYQI